VPRVTVTIEEDYPSELRERLSEYGISLGALSRETGIDRAQLARLFNAGVVPRIDTVQKIELAILAIRARNKGKRKRKP
jgi:predicted transcriptional regulator